MSNEPTPRTDTEIKERDWELMQDRQTVLADFARMLERELAAVTKALEIANKSADDQMFQKREAQKQRDELLAAAEMLSPFVVALQKLCGGQKEAVAIEVAEQAIANAEKL